MSEHNFTTIYPKCESGMVNNNKLTRQILHIINTIVAISLKLELHNMNELMVVEDDEWAFTKQFNSQQSASVCSSLCKNDAKTCTSN